MVADPRSARVILKRKPERSGLRRYLRRLQLGFYFAWLGISGRFDETEIIIEDVPVGLAHRIQDGE